jgi:RNA polymerase sigma factor (sigma-70 family)
MMSTDDPGSITRWIEGLKAGQPAAADAPWRHYYERVVAVARRRLQSDPGSAIEDAEDVALSAVYGHCAGADEGRFEHLDDRMDLWQLLMAITVKKALDRLAWYGRLKRGGNRVLHIQTSTAGAENADENHPDALAQLISKDPTPEAVAVIQEQFRELLDALPDPTLRQIAEWRMEGLSTTEIAKGMGCVVRTVERRIERIRMIWEEIREGPDE